jgi:hypothetical protein
MSQYYCQFCDQMKCNDASPIHRVKSYDNKEKSYDVCEECYVDIVNQFHPHLDIENPHDPMEN